MGPEPFEQQKSVGNKGRERTERSGAFSWGLEAAPRPLVRKRDTNLEGSAVSTKPWLERVLAVTLSTRVAGHKVIQDGSQTKVRSSRWKSLVRYKLDILMFILERTLQSHYNVAKEKQHAERKGHEDLTARALFLCQRLPSKS